MAFELLLIFDEVISLGYRENVELSHIRTIAAMESAEERIQAEIEKNKEREAKEELKKKTRMIEMQKREMAKRGGFQSGNYGGFSSSQSSNSFSSSSPYSKPSYDITPQTSYREERNTNSYSSAPIVNSQSNRKGMQLGHKNNEAALLDSIKAEEGIYIQPTANSISPTGQHHHQSPILSDSGIIQILLDEKISLTANKDGGLSNLEVKGSLMLRILDPAKAQCAVSLKLVDLAGIQYMTHPKVDRQVFLSDSVIRLKDISAGFPVGQALGILKWRFVSKNESDIPLSVYCWPTPCGDGTCDVNMEYTLSNSMELHDVVVNIPYPGQSPPTVGSVDGSFHIDRQKKSIQWQISLIDSSNSSGMMEFKVSSEDISSFYPINVSFTSRDLFCGIQITDIKNNVGQDLEYGTEKIFSTEEYVVV